MLTIVLGGRVMAAWLVMLGLSFAGGSTGARATEAVSIRIENFSFVPDHVTIHVGTTVVWENGDDIPHSIVVAGLSFRSKPLDTHDTATFTFAKAGDVSYFCGLHPHMQGNITVVP